MTGSKVLYCKGLVLIDEERSLGADTSTDRKPAKARNPAMISMPPRKPPPAFFLTPIMYGPKNPPRFPSEFIRAIPAAAAVPLNNDVAVAQNGPCIENVAIRARLTAARLGTMECV